MISFFKKRSYPKFWKKYLEQVADSQKIDAYKEIRFVALDTETTGFDIKKDRILSIGAVAVKNNKILVNDSLELFIRQDIFKKETAVIHGITKEGGQEKIEERKAVKRFVKYLQGGVILGHHTAFDVAMLDQALRRHKLGRLANKKLDTNYLHKNLIRNDPFRKLYSLDELCDTYQIKKHDRHTAMGDALLTAYVFLKIIGKYKRNKALDLMDLLKTNYKLMG